MASMKKKNKGIVSSLEKQRKAAEKSAKRCEKRIAFIYRLSGHYIYGSSFKGDAADDPVIRELFGRISSLKEKKFSAEQKSAALQAILAQRACYSTGKETLEVQL